MAKPIIMKVAKKIATVGTRKGFSVTTLAAKAKVSRGTLTRILNSAVVPYNPTINTVSKLAKGLGMTASELLNVKSIRA